VESESDPDSSGLELRIIRGEINTKPGADGEINYIRER
jgi:hypothetical protein